MTVFIDTNVLIDFVCNRSEFYDAAESVFALGLSGEIDICISDVSIINCLYVGKKYNYTQEQLCGQILSVLKYCKIAQVNNEVLVNALSSDWKDKEDASQYFSALATSADVIVTRNVKDYTLSTIRVTTPVDFLSD